MTPTERAAVAEAIAALEPFANKADSGGVHGALRENGLLTVIAPNGFSFLLEAGAFAYARTALASLRALALAPADQSDAGRDGVIEEMAKAMCDDQEGYKSAAGLVRWRWDSVGEESRNYWRKNARSAFRALASAPSEAPKPSGQEPGGDPGVGRGAGKPYPPSDMDILAGQRDQALEGLTKQKARIRELEKLNAGLSDKVRNLTTLLDQQLGTPCEEIRHAQEVEKLQALALPTVDRDAIREALKEARGILELETGHPASAYLQHVGKIVTKLTAALALIEAGHV